MKVLILNTSPSTGGAAIAARRIGTALGKKGVEVSYAHRRRKLGFYIERLQIWVANRFSKKDLFSVDTACWGEDVTRLKEFKEADIVHLHWINQGFVSLRGLRKILNSGKPVVWTMHDMWPVSGICHYPGDCDGYCENCKSCDCMPARGVNRLATNVFRAKTKIIKGAGILFVGCSKWIASQAARSYLAEGNRFLNIPNPIDMALYSPCSRRKARDIVGLPQGKKLILFGAQKITDKRKGIEYLIEAAKLLYQEGLDAEIVVIGGNAEVYVGLFPLNVHCIDYVRQTEKMVQIYNACDVFVTPSLQDNLPNTIMESLSCATPCVGFDIGGIPEMIDHKLNGYVAQYKSAEDLARGIKWVLEEADYEALRRAAREKVERCYSEEVVAGKYMELYKEVLDARTGRA